MIYSDFLECPLIRELTVRIFKLLHRQQQQQLTSAREFELTTQTGLGPSL